MHGIIFRELKKYVEAKHGKSVWPQLLHETGADGKVYLPIQAYADAEIMALVGRAAVELGLTEAVLLEDFGAFIVDDLISVYRSLIKPEWKTLDLLEHTEAVIHHVVRQRNPGAEPPKLEARRTGASTCSVVYASRRGLCSMARGMIRGVATHYAERVEIDERTCMHRGDAKCTIDVRVV